MSAYREPSFPDDEARPHTLVYEAIDRASAGSSAVALVKLLALPAVVAVTFSAVVDGVVGGLGFALGLGHAAWSSRRRREGAVFTVEGGSLVIAPRRGRPRTISLSDVRSVELEIKTIQRVQEGPSAIPAVRLLESTVGPDVDTARIVIVGASQRMALSDAYLAHMDALEWVGKIRVFLRGHGWVPTDERALVQEDDDD